MPLCVSDKSAHLYLLHASSNTVMSRTESSLIHCNIWVRSGNSDCAIWFCYQLIAIPGNKTVTVFFTSSICWYRIIYPDNSDLGTHFEMIFRFHLTITDFEFSFIHKTFSFIVDTLNLFVASRERDINFMMQNCTPKRSERYRVNRKKHRFKSHTYICIYKCVNMKLHTGLNSYYAAFI